LKEKKEYIFHSLKFSSENNLFININHSHISEISDGDGIPGDDDNDRLYYFYYPETTPETPSTVKTNFLCITLSNPVKVVVNGVSEEESIKNVHYASFYFVSKNRKSRPKTPERD